MSFYISNSHINHNDEFVSSRFGALLRHLNRTIAQYVYYFNKQFYKKGGWKEVSTNISIDSSYYLNSIACPFQSFWSKPKHVWPKLDVLQSDNCETGIVILHLYFEMILKPPHLRWSLWNHLAIKCNLFMRFREKNFLIEWNRKHMCLFALAEP